MIVTAVPFRAFGSGAEDALSGCSNRRQPNDRLSGFRDDDFFPGLGFFDEAGEVCFGGMDIYLHESNLAKSC